MKVNVTLVSYLVYRGVVWQVAKRPVHGDYVAARLTGEDCVGRNMRRAKVLNADPRLSFAVLCRSATQMFVQERRRLG